MNRLARLPWRLSARALGNSSLGQAIGASPPFWQTESQVSIRCGVRAACQPGMHVSDYKESCQRQFSGEVASTAVSSGPDSTSRSKTAVQAVPDLRCS